MAAAEKQEGGGQTVALEQYRHGPLTARAADGYLDRTQVQLLKEQVTGGQGDGVSDHELAYFIQVCRHRNLDPFAKQIYLATRKQQVNGEWKVQRVPETTIDGFRVLAERTGLYEGQTAPQWYDGKRWVEAWVADSPPLACKIGVYRKGFREPLVVVGSYRSFVQMVGKGSDARPGPIWRKMPDHMLAKCVEAQALRKAFPEQLGGLYTSDERPEEYDDAAEVTPAPRRQQQRQQQRQPPVEATATERDTQRDPAGQIPIADMPEDVRPIFEAILAEKDPIDQAGKIRAAIAELGPRPAGADPLVEPATEAHPYFHHFLRALISRASSMETLSRFGAAFHGHLAETDASAVKAAWKQQMAALKARGEG